MTNPRRPTRSQPVTQIVNGYDRKSIHSVNEVLAHVNKTGEAVLFGDEYIKMGSQRYKLFAKSCTCVSCNITGTFFAMERSVDKNGNPVCDGFHFNLYALDQHGNEVLMTKDHIIPKSKGGRDILRNYQTMCTECNRKKGNKYGG